LGDPVASGIVARLDRPGGNVTGFALHEASLGGKWLELLSEIAPGLKRAAIIFNPETAAVSTYRVGRDSKTSKLTILEERTVKLTAPPQDARFKGYTDCCPANSIEIHARFGVM
jgi:hypothetical protein